MHKPAALIPKVVDSHIVDSTFTVACWYYWLDLEKSYAVSVAGYLKMFNKLNVST